MKRPYSFAQGGAKRELTDTSPCRFSTLCDVSINLLVRIKALNAEPAVCQRLREMGFCEFAEIRKVAHGSALLCHVCGVKVALSQCLAKNILVETIDPSYLSVN